MKFITTAILLLFVTSGLFAADDNPVKLELKVTGASELTLTIDQPLTQKTDISIVDLDGVTLYENQMRKREQVGLQFKLDALPKGRYQVVLENRISKTVYPFTVTGGGITIDENKRKRVFKPYVQLEGNQAKLNFFNQNGVAVTVELTDAKGQTVFAEDLGRQATIKRIYNLNGLESSDYRLRVKAGSQTITEYLSL